jgi:hypothetical protein
MTRVEIAEHVRTLLMAHPDVIALYSAQPVLTDIAAQLLPAIVPTLSTPELVRVTDAGSGMTASVLIRVDGQRSATQVCRELYDIITDRPTLPAVACTGHRPSLSPSQPSHSPEYYPDPREPKHANLTTNHRRDQI